ncbi:uncharacterized protein LOC129616505 [Condylostylus longicornis]|uniref:uncharacterized protein LOC129616505 n=1 Tax=Condylostylus longicornis TaxID=2530218 RepID=UPI00244E540A|nr:uncharacterized protein LOC129616505 [Condylostylus longicornis]
MDQYLFHIWSNDRKVKNVFMCNPSIEAVINKENEWFSADSKAKLIQSDNVQTPVNDNISGILENTEYIIIAENEITKHSSPAPSLDTTLSMSSTALSSKSETNSQVSRLFSQFKIPWNKMPHDVSEMLENKKKLNKRLTALANVVVDELRAFSFYIPMSVFRSVAQQAADKFPDSIIEKDENGKFISNEPLALITKMKNRNNTLNRAPKRKIPEIDLNIPLKARRISNVLQKTCPNWQPKKHNSENHTATSAQFKQKFLQEMSKCEEITADNCKKIEEYMKETYAEQRLYLNNRETKIKEFLLNCKNKDIRKHNLETDENIVSNLVSYFKEDVNFIFKKFTFGTTLNTLKDEIPTNTPWAGIVQTDLEGDALIYIFIEKVQVNVFEFVSSDFIGMLELLVCYYYVLNIIFPKEISQFMEFFVRYFLQHYPDGVRGIKKSMNSLNKINSLIVKLSSL